jgi:hypothetical protein
MNDVQGETPPPPQGAMAFKLKFWRTLDQRWFRWQQQRTDKEDLCEGEKHILFKVI